MKIAYLSKNTEVRPVFEGLLEGVGEENEVLSMKSEVEFMDFFKKKTNIKLILIDDYQLEVDVCRFIRGLKLDIPMVVYTDQSKNFIKDNPHYLLENLHNRVIEKQVNISNLLTCLDEVILSLINKEQRDSDSFTLVRSTLFLGLDIYPCDVYIKLNEDKFVKIFKKQDSQSLSDFSKYIAKGNHFFYVKECDYGPLVSQLQRIKKSAVINDEETRNLMIESNMKFIQDKAKELGFTDHTIYYLGKCLDSVHESFKKYKNLGKLFFPKQVEATFLLDHSLMLSYACCAVYEKLSWLNQSMLDKLLMASMIHDLYIDTDEQCRVHSKIGEDFIKLSEEDQRVVTMHPVRISNLIERGTELSIDIATIVKQHHEKPDGSGFPHGLNKSRITALSAVFIIAEEFVYRLEQKSYSNEAIPQIISELKAEFDYPHFSEVIDSLRDYFEAHVNDLASLTC